MRFFYFAAAVPSPEAIKEKAAEIVARPDFQLEVHHDSESLSIWLRVLNWILGTLKHLTDFLEALPHPLWWLVVLSSIAVLVLLLVHITWSIINAFSGSPMRRFLSVADEKGDSAEQLELMARQAEAQGDFIGVVRLLFRASLIRIERSEKKPIRRGITNWELLRRYRSSSLFSSLDYFVRTIDAKWYGHEMCSHDDCQLCQAEYALICGLIERRAHAVGA